MGNTIVWLAAYPKTGSTWLRTIVSELIMPKVPDHEAIPSFHNEHPAEAPYHEVMSTRAQILRTHCHPKHRAFRTQLEQRSDRLVGVITIQRHPLDVLLSQLNYSLSLAQGKYFIDNVAKPVQDIIADGEIDYYIDVFIEAGGWPSYAKRSNPFSGFYSSWHQFAAQTAHLHLRYEDMVSDPINATKSIAHFLQLHIDDAEEIVRRVEERTRINGKFFWRKRAFNFRELVPEDSIRRFENGLEDHLRELGYSRTIDPSSTLASSTKVGSN